MKDGRQSRRVQLGARADEVPAVVWPLLTPREILYTVAIDGKAKDEL